MSNNAPLSHVVCFKLKDASADSITSFVAACKKHLDIPALQQHFYVTTLAHYTRPVNDREFDVALNIVFKTPAAHDEYQAGAAHHAFMHECEPLWSKARVFDSYVT